MVAWCIDLKEDVVQFRGATERNVRTHLEIPRHRASLLRRVVRIKGEVHISLSLRVRSTPPTKMQNHT